MKLKKYVNQIITTKKSSKNLYKKCKNQKISKKKLTGKNVKNLLRIKIATKTKNKLKIRTFYTLYNFY